jgi:hypothetical protein
MPTNRGLFGFALTWKLDPCLGAGVLDGKQNSLVEVICGSVSALKAEEGIFSGLTRPAEKDTLGRTVTVSHLD